MAARPQDVLAGPYSRQVLDEAPGRALKFLGAVGRDREIRALLEERGYTPAVHHDGWQLLHVATGYTAQPDAPTDPAVAAAIKKVDAWDEPNLAIADAALRRRHPAAFAFVFEGLTPGDGAQAINSVTLFLDRLDALEKSPDRRATRAEDKEALATLEARGITPAVRTDLRATLKIARGEGTRTPLAPVADPIPALVALKDWYEEWSSIAKQVVRRRDRLIKLGLAQRARVKKEEPKPA